MRKLFFTLMLILFVSISLYSQHEYKILRKVIIRSGYENIDIGQVVKFINDDAKRQYGNDHKSFHFIRDEQAKAFITFTKLSTYNGGEFYELCNQDKKHFLRSSNSFDCDWILVLSYISEQLNNYERNKSTNSINTWENL